MRPTAHVRKGSLISGRQFWKVCDAQGVALMTAFDTPAGAWHHGQSRGFTMLASIDYDPSHPNKSRRPESFPG